MNHKKRDGALITLLEEADNVAPGASSKAGGFLSSGKDWHKEKAVRALAARSCELHRELAARHGGDKKWDYRPIKVRAVLERLFEEGNSHHFHICDNKKQAARVRFGSGDDFDFSQETSIPWINAAASVSKAEILSDTHETAQVDLGKLCQFLAEQLEGAEGVEMHLETTLEEIIAEEKSKAVSSVRIRMRDGPDFTEHTLEVTDVITMVRIRLASFCAQQGGKVPHFVERASSIQGQRDHSIIIRNARVRDDLSLFAHIYTSNADNGGDKASDSDDSDFHIDIICRPDESVYICGTTEAAVDPPHVEEVVPGEEQIEELCRLANFVIPDVMKKADSSIVQQA
ncbi:hypothetical protein OC842_007709, partial [Tilletia horrida]